MKRLGPAVVLATALAAGMAVPAQGQEVRLAGEPRSDEQSALRDFLEAGDFTLWVKDTVLARSDTVPGSVLLLEGTARIAGRIEGDLYVVDGDLFLRPGASLAGDILVLGGGFYSSGMTEVGGAITYRPNEPLRVRPTGGGYEIISEVEPEPAFELDGTYGFNLPTYDRVSGLSLPVGALARLSGVPGRPELAAGLTWIPAREDVDYRLHNLWRLGERVRLGLFATSAVVSNEDWIRPTWYNSLAHFVAGDDVRDHYDSREFGLELEWASREPPVWEVAPRWRLVISGGREESESLDARDVTVLFGDEYAGRPPYRNRLIDEGTFWFVRSDFEWSVSGRDGRTAFGLGIEHGFAADLAYSQSSCPRDNPNEPDASRPAATAASHAAVGESCDFLLVEGRASARYVTPWGHAVDVFAIGRFDVGGRLPVQRYSTIGGVGTIPTMVLRGLRGPWMVYTEGTYAAPVFGDAALGGLDVFARGSVARVGAPRRSLEWHGSIQGGLALRLWDFQLEFGAAAGSTLESDDPGVIAFVDIRTRKSHRPTRMPPPR